MPVRRIPALIGAIVIVAAGVTSAAAAAPSPSAPSPAPSAGHATSSAILGPDRGAVANAGHKPGPKPSPSPSPTPLPGGAVQLTPWWNPSAPPWEPQGSGTDDAGQAYSDSNYWNFCGPGATAVTLGFWRANSAFAGNGNAFVTGIPRASYTEPNSSLSIRATTTWDAIDSVSSGRGAILYLAENVGPLSDGSGWTYPGIIDWSQAYPYDGTPVNRIRDALNWVINGGATVSNGTLTIDTSASDAGPYAWTPYTSTLTASDIQAGIMADLDGTNPAAQGLPMPVVANVITASGHAHLANWSNRLGVNHSITIIGYVNAQGTYTYVDTCGPGCNNTGDAAGVYTVSQATMVALLVAETDHDGLIW